MPKRSQTLCWHKERLLLPHHTTKGHPMTHIDRMIDEGKFLVDLTEVPNSDTYPRISERLAEVNERRVSEGLPKVDLNWDTLYVEEDTAFVDCYLLCGCGDKIDPDSQLGQCADCTLISEIEAYQNAPLVTPSLLEQFGRGL